MQKPEVYIIVEEIEENNRIYYDVDIQVITGDVPRKKIRFNTLEKARQEINEVFSVKYSVLSVQELLKPEAGGEHSISQKDYKKDVFSPSYIAYEIPFEQFEQEFDYFLTNQKKWTIPYTLTFEKSDEDERMGDVFFFFDIDALIETEIENLENEYGDSLILIDFLQVFLEEMFEMKDVSYDFNIKTEQMIIKCPIQKK